MESKRSEIFDGFEILATLSAVFRGGSGATGFVYSVIISRQLS